MPDLSSSSFPIYHLPSFPPHSPPAPLAFHLPYPANSTSAPSRLTVLASVLDTKTTIRHHLIPLSSVHHRRLPSLPLPPPASHLLLGPVVINPQHAFDSSPSSFLSSHPPPDRARKVTLLFSSHTCHSIYPCNHLTARPRFERQHVGRAIVDLRQLRWQCHGRLREFPRRRCGHRSGRNAQRASWERRGSAATGSKPGTTSSNVSCFSF